MLYSKMAVVAMGIQKEIDRCYMYMYVVENVCTEWHIYPMSSSHVFLDHADIWAILGYCCVRSGLEIK